MPIEAEAGLSDNPAQPAWVLLTASNNRPNMARDPEDDHPILRDTALLSSRSLNASNPAALVQPLPEPSGRPKGPSRCALVLTGELRCIERSAALFERLSAQADLFIVTSAPYRQRALALAPAEHCQIVDDQPAQAAIDAALPVNAMKQWHKLSLALQLIRRQEQKRQKRYRHVVKLRSDYYFAHPERMLQQIANACRAPETGLVVPPTRCLVVRGFDDAVRGLLPGDSPLVRPTGAELLADQPAAGAGLRRCGEVVWHELACAAGGKPPTPADLAPGPDRR